MVVDVGRKERKGRERRRERKKAGRMDGEESFVRMNWSCQQTNLLASELLNKKHPIASIFISQPICPRQLGTRNNNGRKCDAR